MVRRTRFCAALATFRRLAIRACLLVLGLGATPGSAIAADELVLQLHREPQFAFAGYYAALWKGFYREAGLEVEIRPGAPPGAPAIDPVREMTERRARFGTGSAQLLIRAAQGSPLLLLAPIFQQSGTAVYYRAEGDFSSLRALLNAKLGRVLASNILDLELRTALQGEGIDPDKLRSVSIEPGQALTALAEHRVDAVVGSAWELPWQARERGIALKSLTFDGYGPEFYGDSLFTSRRFANGDPATVARFRQASIKGWEYALQHPEEIATRIVAELPLKVPVSDPTGFARYQSEVARRLARFPEVPIGQSDPGRWSKNQQSLIAIGAMSQPVELGTFLYDPGVAARGVMDRPMLPISAAAVAAALLAAAGLLRRRSQRRRANPPPFGQIHLKALMRAGIARLWATTTGWIDRVRGVAHHPVLSSLAARPGQRAIDLNVTLKAFERLIRRQLPNTVKCRLSLQSELWLCRGDPGAVTAMILNLLSEAVADMPAGGELVVGTRQYTIDHAAAAEFPGGAPGDYVRLTIKDSGPGLAPEYLAEIFYPEMTARPAVAAAWELTHGFGGFATVESAKGVGTAVHLYLARSVAIGESAEQPGADDMHALAAE